MPEYKISLGKPGKVFGYVRAIKSFNPTRSPAFAVEIYVPTATPDKRVQWFSSYEVRDNRELVFVSLLRDALVHSLPVELYYDELGFIVDVEVRTTIFYEGGESGTVTGQVRMLSVDEFGLWKDNWDSPNTATVVIGAKPNMEMYLNLQSPERQTKMAQLSLLRRAYQDGSDVTLRYQKVPVMGGAGKTVNLIFGVQLGTSLKLTKPIPTKTGKPFHGIALKWKEK